MTQPTRVLQQLYPWRVAAGAIMALALAMSLTSHAEAAIAVTVTVNDNVAGNQTDMDINPARTRWLQHHRKRDDHRDRARHGGGRW